ncbi:MAG: hypothetical protein QOH31_5334 [Verrucomicrobiota bacterium]
MYLPGLPIPYIEVLIARTRRPFIYPELVIEWLIYITFKYIETATLNRQLARGSVKEALCRILITLP